jgi:hypothetical protein
MIEGAVSLYLAIIAELPMFVCFLSLPLQSTSLFSSQKNQSKKNLIASAVSRVNEKDVEVVFNDEGVKETSCGMVSYAPSSTVQKTGFVEGKMFIQLANEHGREFLQMHSMKSLR